MIDTILKFHEFLYGLNDRNQYKGKNTFLWIITNVGSRFFSWLLFVYIHIRGMLGICSIPKGFRCDDIIVSLTSYPARINIVWMTIDSLLRQTVIPHKIILYLSFEDFPNEKCLPHILTRYKKLGLEIKWIEENLKPHKKYYYAFKEYPSKCVITVDDDIFYRKDMISTLWQLHTKFPNCVCAHRVKKIPSNLDIHYSDWCYSFYDNNVPQHNLLAIGCGGVLYPVSLFVESGVDNINKIKNFALSTDDLWLKVIEIINDIKVVVGYYYCPAPIMMGSQKKSLSKSNWKKESNNDINWKLLCENFSEIRNVLEGE